MVVATACERQDPLSAADATPSLQVPAQTSPAPDEGADVQEITDEYYTAFSPGIEATTLRVEDTTRQYPPGDSAEDNVWTRAYRDKLGVTFQTAWVGGADELPEAVLAMAASGTLPDYMVLPYDTFHSLAAQGMLAPLNEAVNAYAHPSVREALSLYGGAAWQCATYRDELLGLMDAPAYEGMMLWYRDDWFDAAGLSAPPATFEEVLAMAEAFAADPLQSGESTLGFALNPQLFSGSAGYPTGLEGFFAAYGAYPTQWQEENGELSHGSTHVAMKQALSALADLSAKGVLPTQVAQGDPWISVLEEITAGKAGMAFAPYWFTGWLDNSGALIAPEGEAVTWTCMPIPGLSGAPGAVPTAARASEDVTCVRNGFAHPELAVKMVNLTRGLMDGDIAEPQYTDVDNGKTIPTAFMAMAAGGRLSDNGRGDTAYAVTGALASDTHDGLSEEARFLYERCKAWLDKGDATSYALYTQYGPGGSQSVLADMRARGLLMPDAYYGPDTQAMRQDWNALTDARDNMILEVLAGEGAEAAFDRYVRAFQEGGGREITREVNDWFAAR
jgi:putative aldouronate transport system substrate-binding protein